MRGRPWTPEEEKKVIELRKHTTFTYEQIADKIGRSLESVDYRIRQLRKKGMVGYRKPEVQRKLALEAGLVIAPDEKNCKQCHNERSPHYQGFDFKARYEEIKHKK